MNKPYALLLAFALLQGCQNLAPQKAEPPIAEAGKGEAEKPVVYGSFKQDTLYSLLVAELAGQRNRFDIALANYTDQAAKTQDPGVSERAYRIAEYLAPTSRRWITRWSGPAMTHRTSTPSAPPPSS